METKRLLLRKPVLSDLEEMLTICNSPFVLKYNAMTIQSKEELENTLKRTMHEDSTYHIIRKEDQRVIGAIFIDEDRLRYKVNSCCISYFLKEDCSGKGYMTEALQAIIQYLFIEKKRDVIAARVFAENTASAALLKKLGFVYEGCLRHCVLAYGDMIYDDMIFSMLRTEFNADIPSDENC